MIKKYSKLLALFLCTFFFAISPSFAREMTVDELTEELDKISEDASYVYIVGEYAFSSNHTFTREDSMLGGRSIKVENEADKTIEELLKEMTIYRYDRNEDWVLEYGANMIGETKAPEKFNIKYIDYNYIPELSNAEVKPADENAYNEIKNDLGVNFKNDSKIVATADTNSKRTTLLTGVISPNDEIGLNVFPKEDLTGFYYAFTVEGLTDESVVTVEGAKKKTFTKDDFTNGRLVMLMALHPGLDVLGRNITVTVDIDGAKKTYGDTVYTIDYSALVFEGAKTELLTEESDLYAMEDVKNFITNSKYDFSKTTGLKLENGKLTGKILYNGEVGKEFSSRPEDITGYYFPYILTLDGELTDKSVITIPGDGSRKTVTLGQFDDKDNNRIVILAAISPLRANKVIDIIVDLDGDGDKYAQRTYTIDYSEVEFEKIVVSRVEDLMTAINDASITEITLTDNITSASAIVLNHNVNIDLNGKELNAQLNVVNGANVNISNGKVSPAKGTGIIVGSKGKDTNPNTKLVLTNVEVVSTNSTGVFQYGGQVEFVSGKVDSRESALAVRDAGKLVVTDGTFVSHDNSVVSTNGSTGAGKNSITLNGGTYTGTITTPGYIANGIYVANDDEVVVNGGTFNITNGTGILVRSGKVTVSDKVVINVTKNEDLESGWIGDSKVAVPNGKEIVVDKKAGYPGGVPTIENNSTYEELVIE